MKYAALLLNGLAVLLLGWVLYGVAQLGQPRGAGLRPPMIELNPLPTGLDSNQAGFAEMLGTMSQLQTKTRSPEVSIEQLLPLPAPGVNVVDSIQMPKRSLSLHLENLANDTQSVTIDGRLAQRGTRLAEGGRVSQIRTHGAVVTEQLGRQTLALPISELRIGTLRWADGSPASVSTQQFRSNVAGAQPPIVKVTP